MIEIRHLKKEMRTSTPLKDINTVIQKGEVVSIIGPSGTGKTTLLRCICSLEKPTEGEILIDGVDIVHSKDRQAALRKVGMVFQGFNLYPHLTVLENVMVPQIHVLKRSKQEAYDRAVEELKKVGMFAKINNYPDEMSGGQKQRAAIARTLAMDTEIILFDEPTSALDPAMVGEVEYVIRQLAKTGKTMLIVTHEMKFARSVSSKILFLCDGVVCEEGTPEQIFEHPTIEKTADFINLNSREELLITSRYFDFPDAIRRLELFSEKAHMNIRRATALQHLFEEAVMQLLLPTLEGDVSIRAQVCYSEKKEEAELILFSNSTRKVMAPSGSDAASPLTTDTLAPLCEDDLSLARTLIKTTAREYTEELGDFGDGYSHRLKMIF